MDTPRHKTTVDQHRGTHAATGMTIRELTDVITQFSDYSQDSWNDLSADDRAWWTTTLEEIHAARVELAELDADRRERATESLEANDSGDLEGHAATIRRAIAEATA